MGLVRRKLLLVHAVGLRRLPEGVGADRRRGKPLAPPNWWEVGMTERVLGPTGSPRRRWTLLLPFVAAIAFALFAIAGAQAIHEINLFQLDRNAQDAGGAGDDWDTPPNPPGVTSAASIPTSAPTADAIPGRRVEGRHQHRPVALEAGEPLDKDDITNAYAAAYKNTVDTGLNNVGDQLIYFGLDRFSVDGSAQVGFWFLQDPNFGLSQTASGGGFKFNGVHHEQRHARPEPTSPTVV